MQQAFATTDRQVSQCLPAAKRIVVATSVSNKEIHYCVAGAARTVTLFTNQGAVGISAHLSVAAPMAKICP